MLYAYTVKSLSCFILIPLLIGWLCLVKIETEKQCETSVFGKDGK